MDRIIKATIFGGAARVTLIDSLEAIKKSVKLHDLSPLASACLGRSLTFGAYISTNLKGDGSNFRLVVDGDGSLGKINIAGKEGNRIIGYVDNPHVDLPLRDDGKLNVGGAVGKTGEIIVVKDYGLKKPYVGRSPLVSGELGEDFAEYLLRSEGLKSAVALGVRMDASGVIASGGVILEALPDITEYQLVMLEDIMTNFTQISALLCEKSVEEILDFYFGHLECEVLSTDELKLECICSQERIDSLVKQIGIKESKDIIDEVGKLQISCQYCATHYDYDMKRVEELCRKTI